jgi:dihydrofolate reductase
VLTYSGEGPGENGKLTKMKTTSERKDKNMSQLRVESFTISLDGFGAGLDQSLDNPLGIGGQSLHGWALGTRTFQRALFGKDEGSMGVDEDFAARGFQNIGAWIMGRNMFGPIRGPWPDESWKGWWGDNPVYHCPVFVLTHHPRASIEMQGGTVFHFVTGGVHEALRLARKAAGTQDVRLGGGVATIQQFLREKLIDEMHLAVSPVLLGSGERLFDGVDLIKLGYECVEHVGTPNATHVAIRKK